MPDRVVSAWRLFARESLLLLFPTPFLLFDLFLVFEQLLALLVLGRLLHILLPPDLALLFLLCLATSLVHLQEELSVSLSIVGSED